MLKLLLEEALFEDENEEGVVDEQPTDETSTEDEESTGDEEVTPEITNDNLDQVVDDAENSNSEESEDGGEDLQTIEPQTTTYKVTFTLGKHTNWSRIDTVDEEDAKQQVMDYVTKKWPDREFEITDVEEFVEEELEEALLESLGEITDAQPIEDGACVGMASVISDLIKDEYEAIDGYNSAIATAEAEGFVDMVKVLTEIQAEENLHIGQLQAIMNTLDPNAHLVDDGQQEGIEQLANPLGGNEVVEESLKEDLDDMSRQDQEMFIKCVNEFWHMSVVEWTQKYHNGELPVTTVDSYEDIPNTDNLIEIGSSDISQGTGNVIVYTYMNTGDGSLYKYVSF